MRALGKDGLSHNSRDGQAAWARRRQVARATAPLRSAPSNDCAGPMRRFAAMALAARTRTDGRGGQQRPWRTIAARRGQGSRNAPREAGVALTPSTGQAKRAVKTQLRIAKAEAR